MPNSEIDKLFPIYTFDDRPAYREHQRATIARVISAFEDGKRYVVLQAPTGSGKSVIAMTVARYFTEAYFLTPQKILQDQYIRDFSGLGMKTIKGRANYACLEYPEYTAADAPCNVARKDCHNCAYKTAKSEARQAAFTVMNPYYALLETGGEFSAFNPRELLVIDEAHALESILMGHVALEISGKALESAGLDAVMPASYPDTFTQWRPWLREIGALAYRKKDALERESRVAFWDNNPGSFVIYARRIDRLNTLIQKIDTLLDVRDDSLWVVDTERQSSFAGATDRVAFKPVEIQRYAPQILRLGEKVLLMSATILDDEVFTRALGIAPDEYEFIDVPSTFPAANRPIYAGGIGKMSYNHIDANLPKLAGRVAEILEKHPDEKGIIHCNSYKIQKYLAENVDTGRFITHNSGNREDALRAFLDDTGDAVLLSVAMTEGLDLADDASRFQIICKIPYPPYQDKQIAARRARDPEWYQLQTCLTLVQAYGRSVRSETDHAVTYILDSSFHYFLHENADRLPGWFREAIVKKTKTEGE